VATRSSSLLGRWFAAMLAMIVIFIGGLTQLTIYLGGAGPALAAGVTPFALLDIVKALVAALISRPRVRPVSS
jgi:biotin transporter BioY